MFSAGWRAFLRGIPHCRTFRSGFEGPAAESHNEYSRNLADFPQTTIKPAQFSMEVSGQISAELDSPSLLRAHGRRQNMTAGFQRPAGAERRPDPARFHEFGTSEQGPGRRSGRQDGVSAISRYNVGLEIIVIPCAVMRPPRHAFLVEKAILAAIAAIEIYNQPGFRYREETFAVTPRHG